MDEIYAKKTGFVSRGWGDFPPWNQRLTVEADTDEYLALLASVQLKGIMWMLLQHREQLGHKTITKISVFKDEVTGELGYDALHRGPCVYIELGDVQSGAGPSGFAKSVAGPATAVKVGRVRRADKPPIVHPSKVAPRCNARYNPTGNATAIKVDRVRRPDNSPGDASMGSGSGESEGSEGSDQSYLSDASRSPSPPLNAVPLAPYIQKGALAAVYMRASDEQVAAHLVRKGKLKSGERVASQFTDHSAFKSNGWEEMDAYRDDKGVVMAWDVPYTNALRNLGISDEAQPQGKQEQHIYDHTLPWMRNGQSMKVSG